MNFAVNSLKIGFNVPTALPPFHPLGRFAPSPWTPITPPPQSWKQIDTYDDVTAQNNILINIIVNSLAEWTK